MCVSVPAGNRMWRYPIWLKFCTHIKVVYISRHLFGNYDTIMQSRFMAIFVNFPVLKKFQVDANRIQNCPIELKFYVDISFDKY